MYQTKKIDAVKSIQEGFRIAGMNWGLFIGFTVVFLLVSTILGLIPVVNQILSTFIYPILTIGFAVVAHQLVTNRNVSFNNFFDGFQKTVPFLILTLLKTLIGLIFAAPLIYLIFQAFGGWEMIKTLMDNSSPGDVEVAQEKLEIMKSGWRELNIPLLIGAFFLALVPYLLFMFSAFFVWFKNSEPVEALKQSANLVQNNIGAIIIWGILSTLIAIVSAIPCGLGLLFTVPALSCATYAAFASVVDIEDAQAIDTSEHLLGE
jgi:uncharacterized membrane protein